MEDSQLAELVYVVVQVHVGAETLVEQSVESVPHVGLDTSGRLAGTSMLQGMQVAGQLMQWVVTMRAGMGEWGLSGVVRYFEKKVGGEMSRLIVCPLSGAQHLWRSLKVGPRYGYCVRGLHSKRLCHCRVP